MFGRLLANKGACCFLIVLIASAALRAAERISVEVRVSGEASSRGPLTASDFELRENGKPQTVATEYAGQAVAPEGHANLWLYIGLDILASEYPNAQRAILKFIGEQLRPGVMISLGGMPFTDQREDLLKLLLPGPALSEAAVAGRQVPGLMPMWNVGFRALVHGRPMIDRYALLAQQLGQLPGKKAVVVFRDALRLDQDGLDTTAPQPDSASLSTRQPSTRLGLSTVGGLNAEPVQHTRSLERLASEALRNRVAIYPVRPLGGTLGDFGVQGLNQIANVTGGVAVLSEGDPSVIFSRVLRDAADYYVLSYEPSDTSERGRKRRIGVKVNRRGLKASLLVGEYMERQPGEQTAPPRVAATAPAALAVDDAAMRELLATREKADFPLDFSHAVFRGPDGSAAVIYAAGVHPGELRTVEAKGSVEADFSLGVQALRGGEEAAYTSVREKRAFPADEFKKALKDKRMRTNYAAVLRGIAAGEYELRLAWRDETGGQASTARAQFAAPDYSKPLAASSLMITRDAVKGPPEIGNPLGELLVVGDTHFLPDASTKFAAGETLYIVYHLYNVPEAMLAQPPPVQFVAMQNQRPVANAPSGGDGIAMKERNQIRYRVMVQTDQLKPGTYTALVGLPSARGGEPQIITKDFVIE